jgi:lipooligosaccharide transport system ATP-binding protein
MGPSAGNSVSGPVVEARALVKRFAERTAVGGIDLDIVAGETFGILGPNGAGKTTTMRMVSCMSPRTSGGLSVLGMDPATQGSRIKAQLGVVAQQDLLDEEFSVEEILWIHGRYFSLSWVECRRRAAELLEFLQLADRARSTVEPLSGGMKRRLTIARSLINEPRLMLLDEPTTGLDPQARHVVWDRLKRLREQGVTIVLTTHYMDEAEQLCDRLVVMDGGVIIASGSPRELIDRYSTGEVVELTFGFGAAAQAAQELNGLGYRTEVISDRILLYADDGDEALAKARQTRPDVINAIVRRSTLEDVFLRLTGRSLVE